MYIYKGCAIILEFLFKDRVAGLIRALTMHSEDTSCKAMGDHLDQVHSDQKVLKTIRRGGWSFLSETKSLRTNSGRLSCSSPLRSDGSRYSQASGWFV
jgi:hypothetical protein